MALVLGLNSGFDVLSCLEYLLFYNPCFHILCFGIMARVLSDVNDNKADG